MDYTDALFKSSHFLRPLPSFRAGSVRRDFADYVFAPKKRHYTPHLTVQFSPLRSLFTCLRCMHSGLSFPDQLKLIRAALRRSVLPTHSAVSLLPRHLKEFVKPSLKSATNQHPIHVLSLAHNAEAVSFYTLFIHKLIRIFITLLFLLKPFSGIRSLDPLKPLA